MTFPCHTARTFETAVKSHMITSSTVKALATPLMAGLDNADPIWMIASVRPALGKMNCRRQSVDSWLRGEALNLQPTS